MKRAIHLFFHLIQCCFFAFFGLLAGTLAAVVGSVSPLTMLIVGTLVALFWSAVCALLSDFGDWSKPNLAATLYAAVGFCVALIVPVTGTIQLYETAGHERFMSLEVARVAADRFAEIDVDKDGIISVGEINALNFSQTAVEQAALAYLKDNFKEAGRVVATIGQVQNVCRGGDGGLSMAPVCGPDTVDVPIYGVDKDDLATFPSRTLHKWRRW